MSSRLRQRSLAGRWLGLAAIALIVTAVLSAALSEALENAWHGAALALVIGLPMLIALQRIALTPLLSLFRALSGTVTSVRDGDVSIGIVPPREVELAELVEAHNALADVLREERQHLGQRELLLDTVVQNTPVALVLTEPRGRVVYANLAARHLFNAGRRMEGQDFAEVLQESPGALREALDQGGDRLCQVEIEGVEEAFHLSRRTFRLNGRPHDLHLFRRVTHELARQEVATWKKVIRVISHELNNSLAPISSLAHSGNELLKRGDTSRLAKVFGTIEERARHLDGFIRGYAQFAKLPTPRIETVQWTGFLALVREQSPFAFDGKPPEGEARFDPAQLAQVLVNLLKNAQESGSPPDEVRLGVRRAPGGWRIEISDRGTGMSETVLAHALLPFYSTKRAGTGLGLALAREIIEAHGGRIALVNREGGGLSVALFLPE